MQFSNDSTFMKKLFTVLYVFIVTILTFHDSYAATAAAEALDSWRIGFEIEFPFLGVTHVDPHSIEAFSKEVILEGEHWVLMRDTLDSQVEKAFSRDESAGIWNLEFKTKVNGIRLTDAGLLRKAIDEIRAVVAIITSKGRRERQSFGAKDFMVSTINIEEFHGVAHISESIRGKKVKFVFKSSIGKDDEAAIMQSVQQVLPQLTFQFPIAFVRRFFEHLYILGSNSIVEFFKNKYSKQLYKDPELDGFNLLFDYYMYKFFSVHDRREPGPKGSFPLMSRINFKDMYAHLLPPQQDAFRDGVMSRYAHFEMFDAAYKALEQKIKDLYYTLERYQKVKKEKDASESKLRELQTEFGDGDIRTQTLKAFVSTLGSLNGFDVHASQTQRIIEEKKELLQRVKVKDLHTPLVARYSQNRFIEGSNGELVPETVQFSVEEVLRSIVDPHFNKDILVEGDTDKPIKINKRTDIFSTPFSRLDLKYSMGVLDYPHELREPIAVLEVRAYPRILGDCILDNILPFLEAEIAYCLGIQQDIRDIPKVNEVNLASLFSISSFIKFSIDKCKERAQEIGRELLSGGKS